MNTTTTVLVVGLLAALSTPADAGGDICEKTAKLQKSSAAFELKEELKVSLAVCENLTDPVARAECRQQARADYQENKQLANDQFLARLDLCDLLGGGAYDPDIDPDEFSTTIDNPFLPFPVGAMWLYEGESEDGMEFIEIEVLDSTREILGVECVSVRDVVYDEDGEAVEDTIDWFAQDSDGNVWYFGEISFNYEDGFIADVEGSWLAGVDGAKPGIVMLADPTVGVTYRQEWLLGDAEDAATVLSVDATLSIGLGMFDDCVQTADFLPPEPDELEHKFYAEGIGFLFETKPGEDETVELVGYTGL